MAVNPNQPTPKPPHGSPEDPLKPLPVDAPTEKELDSALDQSFPASDPPAHQLEKQPADTDKPVSGRP